MTHASGSASHILVLGGGIGGISTVRRLRRRLGAAHQITLVSRDPQFRFDASNLWVLSGARTAAEISRPLSRLSRHGIKVVTDTVQAIDAQRRRIRLSDGWLDADYLVVSLGAEYGDDRVPGLALHGHSLATSGGAQALHDRIRALDAGRVVVLTSEPIYRCPAAPYEAALLIDDVLRRCQVRSRVEVAIHAAEPMPMGVAGRAVGSAVVAMLEERGISYVPRHQVLGVEPGCAEFADGASLDFDVLAYMPGIRPPRAVIGSDLRGPDDWIEVDRHTMATRFAHVYAIGDNVQIPLSMG